VTVKLFEEYIAEGIAKKQSPDISRSNALFKETETDYSVLNEYITKLGLNDRNANYVVKNTYDLIMGLIRARMIFDGFSSSGNGAHEAEVAYCRNFKFKDSEIDFLDKLRYFRNGILYYGKNFNKDYALKVLDFLNKVYPKLKK
jgi:hypothetical protein